MKILKKSKKTSFLCTLLRNRPTGTSKTEFTEKLSGENGIPKRHFQKTFFPAYILEIKPHFAPSIKKWLKLEISAIFILLLSPQSNIVHTDTLLVLEDTIALSDRSLNRLSTGPGKAEISTGSPAFKKIKNSLLIPRGKD